MLETVQNCWDTLHSDVYVVYPGIPSSVNGGLQRGTCGMFCVYSVYSALIPKKTLQTSAKKHFVKKWGRVGLEEHVH